MYVIMLWTKVQFCFRNQRKSANNFFHEHSTCRFGENTWYFEVTFWLKLTLFPILILTAIFLCQNSIFTSFCEIAT